MHRKQTPGGSESFLDTDDEIVTTSRPLPEGWVKKYSEITNEYYYLNTVDGHSSHIHPNDILDEKDEKGKGKSKNPFHKVVDFFKDEHEQLKSRREQERKFNEGLYDAEEWKEKREKREKQKEIFTGIGDVLDAAADLLPSG